MPRYNNLYPPFKELILKFEENFLEKVGIPIFLFSGYRSHKEQLRLHNIGRVTEGKIVTNAYPGNSYHQYGLASDYVFDFDLHKDGIQWSWDKKFPWEEIGIISKELGFGWGGDFKSIKDYPHIQKTWGISIARCKSLYEKGGIKDVWSYLDVLRSTYDNQGIIEKNKSKNNNKVINNNENLKNNKKIQEKNNVKQDKKIFSVIKVFLKIISFISNFRRGRK